jgi:hypothetical protein
VTFRRTHTIRQATRGGSAALASALIATLVLAMPAEAGPAAATAPNPREDMLTSFAEAESTGTRVEIITKRGASTQTFANPDGTLTTEESVEVERVQRDGEWVDVDTTLIRDADGRLRPAAAALDMAFSGGGTEPLIEVNRDEATVTLDWAGQLPEPVLDGPTATYHDVMPGVDLRMTASAETFSQVLIVEDEQAAQNPDLAELEFDTNVQGGSLEPTNDGGFRIADESGDTLLTATEPTMWDSSGKEAAEVSERSDTVPVTAEEDVRVVEGDEVATMDLDVTADAVVIEPDQEMLASADTTYPVFIDPTITSPTRNGWTMVSKQYPTTEYWKWSGDEGVGYQNASGVSTKRLFYQFSTSGLAGKAIHSATFKAYQVHSWSCTASRIDLHQSAGISSSTNWSNMPSPGTLQQSRTVANGRSGCNPNGAWVEFNATNAVTATAANGWSNLALLLKAYSETDPNGWKRFRPDAVLSVTYNVLPSTPSSLKTTYPTTSCITGASRPVIPKDGPRLSARITDADDATLDATFELWKYSGTSTYEWRWTTPSPLSSGSTFTTTDVPSTEIPDGTYKWRVRGINSGYDTGPWSSWCEFRVDSSAPVAPTATVPNASYDFGTPITATLGAGGATDVTYYRYSVNNDVPTSGNITKVTTTTVTFTPDVFGPVTLRVWAYDAAGNRSPGTALEITVNQALELHRWSFDEGSGTSAANSIAGGPAMTLSSTATWGGGYWNYIDPLAFPNDRAMVMGTSVASATTSAPAIATDKSFSFGGRAQPDSLASVPVLISQGAAGAEVRVSLRNTTGVPEIVVGTPGGNVAAFIPSYVEGDWLHYAVAYNAGDRALDVYVNGERVSETNLPNAITATTGGLRIGSGASGGSWTGRSEDVRVFKGFIDDNTIFRIAFEAPV